MRSRAFVATACLTVTSVVRGNIYFQEDFNDEKWVDRWVQSEWKSADQVGAFKQVEGKFFVDKKDKALQTSEDARFYALSAKFDKAFDNLDKDFYLSYFMQHEQYIDCGGAYVKVLPEGLEQKKFGGDAPYNVMFGPDSCGSSKRIHAILNYARPNAEPVNMDHRSEIADDSDSKPHLYSFVLKNDNTYEVRVDGAVKSSGSMHENWPFQPEKKIPDPNVSKPADWVDETEIVDPGDAKPDNWDDIPATIPDKDATIPDDWDEEEDGEWQPPQIDNPEYKGEWKPKMIKNPAYQGAWVHPEIENPDFFEDDKVHHVVKNALYLGFDLWQVTTGTLFDDILVTDDEETFARHEKRVMEKVEAIRQRKLDVEEEERKKSEAEQAAKGKQADEDGEDEELDLSEGESLTIPEKSSEEAQEEPEKDEL
uniref:Calreticulin n=1 Tax=Albugo laibachii Nc14 TaxID=890382 RepID=F0WGZ7_9STRA|nr:calreticulin precursor putative [Albugo laibachii Nc14]|eukprot:CCA20512.1 calreticulin precursor putative [Albugo laibachii Nc14]